MRPSGYRGHQSFTRLSPRTRRDYHRCFEYLYPIKDTPVSALRRRLVAGIRDKAGEKLGWKWGNYVLTVLSLVCKHAVEREWLDSNPCEGVSRLRRPDGAKRANRPWSDTERFAVLDAAPWSLKVPLALGMYTAIRLGDVLSLPREAYDGEVIEIKTSKTGQKIVCIVIPQLREILAAAPPHDAETIAASSKGERWTIDGFRSSWHKFRKRLEAEGRIQPGLTFHGLRHTYATLLREAGFDNRTIADALGQSSEQIARHYSRDADLQDEMRKVSEVVGRNEAKRIETSNDH